MQPSLRPCSVDLTGSVCKEQGRIHRSLMTSDYYRFQHHEGELQPSIRTKPGFRGLASPFGVASNCTRHCRARVAREIRVIQTYRCLHLPPRYQGSPAIVLDHSVELASK